MCNRFILAQRVATKQKRHLVRKAGMSLNAGGWGVAGRGGRVKDRSPDRLRLARRLGI